MHVLFTDDSTREPTRPGMGTLVAAGGVVVAGDQIRPLNTALDRLCERYGFPAKQPFKWSPGGELWMRTNLVGGDRTRFFADSLETAALHGVVAHVAVADTSGPKATGAASSEMDVTTMLLERVNIFCDHAGSRVCVIADRRSNAKADRRFIEDCLAVIENGTTYSRLDRIVNAPTCGISEHHRLLQLADLVTSCTNAVVAGHLTYALPTFEDIRGLLDSRDGRIAGRGLKIWPTKHHHLYASLLAPTLAAPIGIPSGRVLAPGWETEPDDLPF